MINGKLIPSLYSEDEALEEDYEEGDLLTGEFEGESDGDEENDDDWNEDEEE